MNYDSTGRSLGTTDVVFVKREDAIKALKTYNGVPLDGRAMKIVMAVDIKEVERSPARSSGFGSQNGGGFRNGGYGSFRSERGRGDRGGRGRGRGGRGGRGRDREPAPSKDDLDNDLDSYTKAKN